MRLTVNISNDIQINAIFFLFQYFLQYIWHKKLKIRE